MATVSHDKPLRALIWCAVSTASQADEDERYSLPSQESDGLAWCKANGADVVDVLNVPGHSRAYRSLDKLAADARTQHIDAFDKLIDHLDAHDFDVLWCRDANRFARKASLLHYIVECIIEDCAARIYSANDGWVDATNADIFAMVKGYTTAKEMKWLREASIRGKDKLAERGLPVGPRLVLSHQRIRDERTGKTVAVVVNESMRRLFDDLATLILEGVGWNKIGHELYSRFGHVDQTGRPYSSASIYFMVTNPQFWGHAFRRKGEAGKTVGRWIFDADCPPPSNVTIWRDKLPAVYTGDQAEAIKAEMRRRMGLSGRARPYDTYQFSGLFVCGECGSSMTAYVKDGKRYGLRCSGSRHQTGRKPRCSQRRLVHDTYLQTHISILIGLLLDGEWAAMLDAPPERQDGEQLAQIRAEIATVERQLDTLITEQSLAPTAAQPRYRERVQALADRLDILQDRAGVLSREVTASEIETRASERTLEEIRTLTLAAFWQSPSRQINQLLKSLFGPRKLVIHEKAVVGSIRTS